MFAFYLAVFDYICEFWLNTFKEILNTFDEGLSLWKSLKHVCEIFAFLYTSEIPITDAIYPLPIFKPIIYVSEHGLIRELMDY